jgi:glyoxylate carboligase
VNLTTGLANALIDCSPVVAFGGSSPVNEYLTGAFQEIDQVAVMKPVTKWANRVYETRRIPEMIDRLVKNIPEAREGFKLLFSSTPFPGFDAKVDFVTGESGGAWYRWAAEDLQGWLCPALLKYFSAPPATLYCKAGPIGA